MSNLKIKYRQENHQVQINLNSTLRDLKIILSRITKIEPESQQIVLKGKILTDEETTLQEHGVKENTELYLARKSENEAQRSALHRKDSMEGAEKPKTLQDVKRQQKEAARMQSMFAAPILRTMKNNPEILKELLLSNPDMKGIFESNPELKDALSDPRMIEQMIASMENPDVAKEMMRTNDLALSNIETIPDGFKTLRHVYETIADPAFEAMKKKDPKAEDEKDPHEKDRTEHKPMPNPWKTQRQNKAEEAIRQLEKEEMKEDDTLKYTKEAKEMVVMGFPDEEENLNALIEASGDMSAAIDRVVGKYKDADA